MPSPEYELGPSPGPRVPAYDGGWCTGWAAREEAPVKLSQSGVISCYRDTGQVTCDPGSSGDKM